MSSLSQSVEMEPSIKRRHVFYVEGYDPRGAGYYHRLFQREWQRFVKVWPVEATLGDLQIDSDDLAHWDIEAKGPNWQVSTRYEFLRLEQLLRSNLSQPLPRQLWRAFRWIFDDLVSGALWRIFRASWRFGLHLVWPQLMLWMWLAVAIGAGLFAGEASTRFLAVPEWLNFPIIGLAAVASFAALRPLADRWHIMQVINGWPFLREFARGKQSAFDRPVELLAQRLVAVARAAEVDEIIVVSHSAGGVYGPCIVARALELDPELGRHGPRVRLMTVGSLMPAFALHPAADRIRAVVKRLAVEQSVRWVDCQARKDVMNFFRFDPVGGVGIDAGPGRRNPIVWSVRFRDVISPDIYKAMRWRFFRIHFQFIMASDRRASYDYFLVVCGPAPLTAWASSNGEILAAFSAEAGFDPGRSVGATA
ncbi:MAG TPA: hypothetical protein VHN11_18230 [Xanthobacteraceae bacterium]|jgi:hypothetical protein|nr:hypothetical protein [Xanthobacteraceae bacterium]